MRIEISTGEALDKLSILKIKLNNIHDVNKLYNINKEYEHIYIQCQEVLKDQNIITLYDELYKINNILWNTEDQIRLKEKAQIFDEEFVQLARNVYITNDRRSDIKTQINTLTQSNFIEEKSYAKY